MRPMQECFRWYGPDDPVPIAHIRQAGATGIVTALHEIYDGSAWPAAAIRARKAEIEAAPDPNAKRAELEAFYLNMTSPFRTAEKFGILDIIDPRETRGILCDWVEDAWALVSARRASAA